MGGRQHRAQVVEGQRPHPRQPRPAPRGGLRRAHTASSRANRSSLRSEDDCGSRLIGVGHKPRSGAVTRRCRATCCCSPAAASGSGPPSRSSPTGSVASSTGCSEPRAVAPPAEGRGSSIPRAAPIHVARPRPLTPHPSLLPPPARTAGGGRRAGGGNRARSLSPCQGPRPAGIVNRCSRVRARIRAQG